MEYDVIEFDVVPSGVSYEEEGTDYVSYDVNGSWNSGETVALTDDMTDSEIIQVLRDEGWIRSSVPDSDVEIEGEHEFSLFINHSTENSWRPVYELRYAVS